MTDEQKGALGTSLEYLLSRLKEPSSWAGIALFIGMFGFSPETVNRITANGPAIITALAALAAIFAPSAGRKALGVAREAHTVSTATAEQVGPPASTVAEQVAGDGQL